MEAIDLLRDITLRGSGKKYMTEGGKNEFWQEIISSFYNRPWTTMEGHRLLFLLCGQSVLLGVQGRPRMRLLQFGPSSQSVDAFHCFIVGEILYHTGNLLVTLLRLTVHPGRRVGLAAVCEEGLQLANTCEDEAKVGWRGSQRPADVFRMILHRTVEGVAGKFNHLHSLTGDILSDKLQPRRLEFRNILRVHLVSVSVTFIHSVSISIKLPQNTVSCLEHSLSLAQPHGSPKVASMVFWHINHNWVGRVRSHLCAVRVRPVQDIPSKLDHRALEAEADTKVRLSCGSTPAGSFHLSRGASHPKATWHNHPIDLTKRLPCFMVLHRISNLRLLLQVCSSNVSKFELVVCRQGSVSQRLDDRGVSVLQLRVLPHQGDLHKLAQVLCTVGQLPPPGHELARLLDCKSKL